MAELIQTMQRLRAAGVFVAMVYLQEAHADDLWPLGYGILSHSTIDERIGACRRFLDKNSGFSGLLQGVAVDTMDDHFLHTYGAWPERYFLTDISGRVLWASATGDDESQDNRTSNALHQVLNLV